MASRHAESPPLQSDKIGRDLCSRSDCRKVKNGETPVSVFMDDRSPDKISVNRLTREPGQAPPANRPEIASDEVIARISDLRAISNNRNFHCWAVLSVRDAEKSGRTVEPSPSEDNDYHMDIALPSEVEKDQDKRREHAEELAADATWRPRPNMERPGAD